MEKKYPEPNIVLILTDMVPAKSLGCYGNPLKVTPVVDELADGGTIFTNAYCAATPCIPARASLMTGCYSHTHGKTAHIRMEMEPKRKLLPEILSERGYSTGLVGKTHWWPPDSTLGCEEAFITIDNHLTPELGKKDAYMHFLEKKGLFSYNEETWEQDKIKLGPDNIPFDCLKVNWTGDTAIELINKFSNRDKPFFINCSFVEPHVEPFGPGKAPMQSLRDIPAGSVPTPRSFTGKAGKKPEIQKSAVRMWDVPDEKKRWVREEHFALLKLVDNNIGKIMSALNDRGVLENTVVIFTSDHGDLLYDHGCIEKTFLYEESVKIPFIINDIRAKNQKRIDRFISQVDLFPTVCSYAGIDEDKYNVEGRNIVSLIENESVPWRDRVFCEVEQTVHLKKIVDSSSAKMIRTGPWKYIFTIVNGNTIEEELYNLDDDPDELYNAAGLSVHRERIFDFRTKILQWLTVTEGNRLFPDIKNTYPVPGGGRYFTGD